MKVKKETKKLGSAFHLVYRTLTYFYGEAFRYQPLYFIFIILLIIINALSPFINILLPKYIIDELLGNKNPAYIGLLILMICAGNFLFGTGRVLVNGTLEKYSDSFERYFNIKMGCRTMDMDFEHTEDPAALEQVSKAQTGMSWYSGGIQGLTFCFVNIISNIIILFGVIFLLSAHSPLLLITSILVVIIRAFINSKINAINMAHFKRLVNINRGFGYVFWQLSNFKVGKDIRLYDGTDMMLQKADNYNLDMQQKWKEQSRATLKCQEVDVFVSGLSTAFNYFYLGFRMLRQTITIGDFNMLISSCDSFQNALKDITWNLQEIHKKSSFMEEYIIFMEYPDALEKGSLSVPKNTSLTFTFKNVGFKYPRSETYVLKNINLTLSDKEHLSIVGLNGAGKTTMVKLLCRLYDVTEGEILLNGINIKEYDYEEYLKLFSVVFQDFKLFAFSIKDNILLKKQSEQNGDSDARLISTVKNSGLEEKISSLKDGINSIIYKGFDENGIDVSGGEAQKIAIARALYKDSPVVILDEPTAALDPVAEYEIYNHFDNLVGGKIALYISHRLSSCKFCDNIAVFSKDTIAEYGTHDELVKKEDGIYREMFMAQANYYT